MKLGELKIECLAVMDELDEEITLETLSNFEKDESLKDLFFRMNGSINRAMDRMANKKKLPLCSEDLTDYTELNNYLVFDLSKISRFRNIKRVSCQSSCGYLPSVEYILEGSKLYVSNQLSGNLKLIFYPKAPAINSNTSNDEELNIPDELARIIPYYVKSDLMARDESELAVLARNKFESALDEVNLNEEDTFNTMIEKKYRIGW